MARTRIFAAMAAWLVLPCALAHAHVHVRARIGGGEGGVRRLQFSSGAKNLAIEVLDDKIVHFEYSLTKSATEAIYLTPYIDQEKFKENFAGPSGLRVAGHQLETAALRLDVDPESLCVAAYDKFKERDLTRICPQNLESDWKSLAIERRHMTDVYGLGEQFLKSRIGRSDGNWMGETREPGDENGNYMTSFHGGFTENAQFPILYAVGPDSHNYALFLDQVYKQTWDFHADPWRVEMWGDQVRFFLIAGEDLPELRTSYMKLVGHPLVPPKKAFGLWVSQYGFESWNEVRDKLRTLREHHFPVDGFVLDLQWYGGITQDESSRMGSLRFDEKNFPNPRETIREFREKEGIGLIAIEESYVARGLSEHRELEAKGFLARESFDSNKAFFINNALPWWGLGGMIDWSNPEAGRYWHRSKRQLLINLGIMGHWTDLGEPEMYTDKNRPGAVPFYYGFPELKKYREADVHNVFSLLWHKSIYDGYQESQTRQRPWILSRSGGPGIQRYGAGLWSGDIGSNFGSLASQLNVQMQMSLSGIDYFGSDIGGFHRRALAEEPGIELGELYTQWFADGAAFDLPVRPHTENVDHTRETAPDRVGDLKSNLANIRLRYELSPYYYTLAHRAYLFGEPVVPPLVYYYQDAPTDRADLNVRTMGHEKLIGQDLLFAAVARAGERARDVYLPPGEWVDYYTNSRYLSAGKTLSGYSVYSGGIFRLPLFVRAGAIIPKMFVDDKTMDIEGRRTDGSVRSELILRVYSASDSEPREFTLYEDDGRTSEYLKGAVAATRIEQRLQNGHFLVTIEGAKGTYAGAPRARQNIIEAVVSPVKNSDRISVLLGDTHLPRWSTAAEFEAAASGVFVEAGGQVIHAKSPPLPVGQAKVFEFILE